ncbi:hypothetical protein [uncultured Rhodospira sp.]|uniref:hypothetical protein n=1 Tax=uncultured Rhodospira sp. TaxID=1936189 RepID=UPI0026153094|nr:hypothetical protein [uncultured Rhodospira sp.]
MGRTIRNSRGKPDARKRALRGKRFEAHRLAVRRREFRCTEVASPEDIKALYPEFEPDPVYSPEHDD